MKITKLQLQKLIKEQIRGANNFTEIEPLVRNIYNFIEKNKNKLFSETQYMIAKKKLIDFKEYIDSI